MKKINTEKFKAGGAKAGKAVNKLIIAGIGLLIVNMLSNMSREEVRTCLLYTSPSPRDS